MSIRFNDVTLKTNDRHGWPRAERPDSVADRKFYWGQGVTGEVRGGIGSRTIMLETFIVDTSFTTAQKLFDYLRTVVDAGVNQHGTLTVQVGSDSVEYKNCTFDGFEPITDIHRGGVPKADPLFNQALPASQQIGPGGYWVQGTLVFTQLKVTG